MILLDTHVLIWLDQDNPRLGPTSRTAIDEALAEDDLAVSAITFWEVAMLVAKQRLVIAIPLDQWRRDLIAGGIRELPLDGRVGLLAADLELHRDPADRFVAATATINEATLATADQRLLAWQANVERLDATR